VLGPVREFLLCLAHPVVTGHASHRCPLLLLPRTNSRHEITIMAKLDHPNVIKFHEFFEDAHRLYIVMELLQGGELFSYMRRKFQKRGCIHRNCKCLVPCCCLVKVHAYSEKQVAQWLRQVAEGLKYLHSLRIVHADLKPHNVMFVSKDDDSQLKIIDFGLASIVKKKHLIRGQDGTPEYMAPEVVQGRYTYHSDMWSFGCLMFTMLFGYSPFWTHSVYETYHLIVDHGFRPDKPTPGYDNSFPNFPKVSESAKDLIVKLLQRDPVRRLTAAEALEHPWLAGRDATDVELPRVAASLVQMHDRTLLQRLVMNLIIDSLTEKDLEEWKKSIPHIAQVGDKITVNNLKSLLRRAKHLNLDEVKTPTTVHRSLHQTPTEFTKSTAEGVAEILNETMGDPVMQAKILEENASLMSPNPEMYTAPKSMHSTTAAEQSSRSSSGVGISDIQSMRNQLELIQRRAEANDLKDHDDEESQRGCLCFGRKSKKSKRETHTRIDRFSEEDEAGVARKMRDVDWAAFNLREMLISSIEYRLLMKEERIWSAFDRIDADHDGLITAKELAQVLKIPLDLAQRIVQSADQNGDGVINLDEFLTEFSKREHNRQAFEESKLGSEYSQTDGVSSLNNQSSDSRSGGSYVSVSTAEAKSTSASDAKVTSVSFPEPGMPPLPAPTVTIEVKPEPGSDDEAAAREGADTVPVPAEIRSKQQTVKADGLDLGLELDISAPKAGATVQAIGLGHADTLATPLSAERARVQFANATGLVPTLLPRIVAASESLSQGVRKPPANPIAAVVPPSKTPPQAYRQSGSRASGVGMADIQLEDTPFIVGCPISSVIPDPTHHSPVVGLRRIPVERPKITEASDESDDNLERAPSVEAKVNQDVLRGYIASRQQ